MHVTETRVCDGTTHRTSEVQNASTAVSTTSSKTPDDDPRWLKHVVYNVFLNRFKRFIGIYVVIFKRVLHVRRNIRDTC
jgi:hypothetical protein